MLSLTESWNDEIDNGRGLRPGSRGLMKAAVRKHLGLDTEWPTVTETEWNALVIDTIGGVEVMGARVRLHHDNNDPDDGNWHLILVPMTTTAAPRNGDPAVALETEEPPHVESVMSRLGYGPGEYDLSKGGAPTRIDRERLYDANPQWRWHFADGYAAGIEDGLANRVVGPRWHRTGDWGDGYREAMQVFGRRVLRAIAASQRD